ncbi:MAG: sulfurtransferase TusA family protein [Acidilobus sp.]
MRWYAIKDKASKILDLRGLDCPEPAMLLYREFGKLSAGEWVEAEMDIKECAMTAAELINRSGFGVATLEEVGDRKYIVRALRLR